jgi:phosphoenolpyruvate-protein kinase (PTS system EI component)
MAGDPALAAELERAVRAGRPAAAALVEAAETMAAAIASLDHAGLAARADDVRSLGRRAARAADAAPVAAGEPPPGPAGEAVPGSAAAEPVVLVADDLGPADVAELGSGTAAVALAGGSPTAHAAIVARGLGIPMVVGLGPDVLDAAGSTLLAVDGSAGTVTLGASGARLAAARAATASRRAEADRARADSALPSVTRDGHPVRVLVNVATAAELATGLRAGAEGVGLLRTELAFLDAGAWPDEATHRRALGPLLGALAGRIATVRVLDFGGDKTPPFLRDTSERGIALLLAAPAALEAQLRAIVAAGAGTELRVLLPLAETAGQVDAVRALVPPGTRIGAMVETASAVARAPELAGAADFLSIGTNDLTHDVLGTSRFASGTAAARDGTGGIADTRDPRVLGAIAAVARAAREAGVVLEVCGEAASDPELVPLLVGLGVDELSVGAARVAGVRAAIRGLDRGQAEGLARQALGAAGDGAPGRSGRASR